MSRDDYGRWDDDADGQDQDWPDRGGPRQGATRQRSPGYPAEPDYSGRDDSGSHTDPFARPDPYGRNSGSRPGQHSAADPYGPAAGNGAGGYGSADPYGTQPPYGGERDRGNGRSGRADSYPGQDPYAPADWSPQQNPYPPRDSYTGPEQYAEQDRYASPDSYGYGGQNDYTNQNGYAGSEGYGEPDRYGGHERYGGSEGYGGSAGYAGQDRYSAGYGAEDPYRESPSAARNGYDGAGYDAAHYAADDTGSGYVTEAGYPPGQGYAPAQGYPAGQGYAADGYPRGSGYDDGDYEAGNYQGYGVGGYPGEASGYSDGRGFDQRDYGPEAAREARQPYGADAQAFLPGSAQPDRGYGWQESTDDTGGAPSRPADRGGRSGRGRPADPGERGSRANPADGMDADDSRHNGFFSGFGRADDEYGHRPPRQRRSRGGVVALCVVIVFIVGLVGAGLYGYHWYEKRHADWTGSAGYGSVVVHVLAGEAACSAGMENALVSKGVVASAEAFCDAAKASSNPTGLEPGYFRLRKHMGAAEAYALLINPSSRVQTTVTVPDGLRASRVLATLAAKTGIPLSQFNSALKDTTALGLPSWAQGNPEGFLYPDTYNIQPGSSALSILQMMVKQFNAEMTSLNLAAGAQHAQFTEYQVIIEASLLEGEVGPQYYAQVARVIDNRLNQSPPWNLQLDSTVAYAVDDYKYNLSQSQLNVNSPYNTFTHVGLPPGPIDSPDAAAISAVLHPAQGDWLYFVTVNKQGLTYFTTSSVQFQTWASEAVANGV